MPKAATSRSKTPKKDTPQKEIKKKKKEEKPPAKNLREYTLADGMDKRLKPESNKRASKPISRFEEKVEEPKHKEIVIPDGKGKTLEEIDPIGAEINKRNRTDEILKEMHNFILGRVTKKVDVKANLLEFNGIVYDETKTREYWEKKSDGLTKITLRQCCAFLGVDPSGNKSEIATRLLDFLEKPKDTGETFDIPNDPSKKRKTASRGRSRSRSRSKSPSRKKQKTDKRKTKKKKDPNAPKRPMTAFLRYSQEHREEIKKKNPDWKVTEISTKLGEQWKKLSKDKKSSYEKEYEKDKEKYDKEVKKYKGTK